VDAKLNHRLKSVPPNAGCKQKRKVLTYLYTNDQD